MCFMRIQTRPFLFFFCLYAFCAFCACEIFSRIKKSKTALMTSLHYYWVKSYFLSPKKPAIFTGSKQSKTPFERNFVTYGTLCHVYLFFYYHNVTYRTPCHTSAHLVIFTVSATNLRERFLLLGVFYLRLLPASFKVSLVPAVWP